MNILHNVHRPYSNYSWLLMPPLVSTTSHIKITYPHSTLTLCPSWQELPKSTILMALRLGLQSRMFSGLRSQWMTLSSGVARKSRAVHSCCANFLVRLSDTPRKLVFRSRSYRLYESSSNTRQRWFLYMKFLFSFTVRRSILVTYTKKEQTEH